MSRVILHIGAGKTGTSYLQSCLSLNEEQLLAYGIYYPRSPKHDLAIRGGITGGNGQVIAASLNPRIFQNHSRSALGEPLDVALERSNGRDILYSAESMQFFEEEKMFELRSYLHGRNYSLEIVLYIRNMTDMLYSTYNQSVKRSGMTKSFGDFIRSHRPIFVQTLRRLESSVGRDSVSVRNYDIVRGDLLRDFCKCIGIDGLSQSPSGAIVNRSLDVDEIEIVVELNRLLKDAAHGSVISDAILYGNPDIAARKKISTDDVRYISERYLDDAEYVNSFLAPGEGIGLGVESGEPFDFGLSVKEKAIISLIGLLLKRQFGVTR